MTVRVQAKYEVQSPNRIRLTFKRAGFGDINISSELESFLAPALLPRGTLNHQALLGLREVVLPQGSPGWFKAYPGLGGRGV